jgi:hypothetical protein
VIKRPTAPPAAWPFAWLLVMIIAVVAGVSGMLSAHAMIKQEIAFGMLDRAQDWEFVALSYGIPCVLLCIGLAGTAHGVWLIKKTSAEIAN